MVAEVTQRVNVSEVRHPYHSTDSTSQHCCTSQARLFDFRGHGSRGSESLSVDGRTPSWDEFGVSDVMREVERLRATHHHEEPLVGVGHSMGGACLVKAELAHPGTFHALVLCEPILIATDVDFQQPNQLSKRALKRVNHWNTRDEAASYLRERSMFRPWHQDAFDGYVDGGLKVDEDGTVSLACPPRTESETFRAGGESVNTRLGEVQCPVHIVVGSESQTFQQPNFDTVQYFERVAASFPRGSMHVIPGASHFGPQEAPGTMAQQIESIIAAHPVVRSSL